jgi:Protein of unknown function (DUF2877)
MRWRAGLGAMEPLVSLDVIVAGAGLARLLQDISWEGQIAAVFQRGILCTTAEEHLIHLHTGPHLASPFSLRVAGDLVTLLYGTPWNQGMPVRKTDRTIAIAGVLHLNLGHVAYYKSPRCLSGAAAPEAIGQARQILSVYGRGGGFTQLPGAQLMATAMYQALADRDTAQLLAAIQPLIGLGPGLTPSGDDVLVGCLKGLWLIRGHTLWMNQTFENLRQALLPDLHLRTTRVGAEFIRYALAGAFAEVLDQAALALLEPVHPSVVQSAVSRLLAQGETSGTDTMLGLLTCLEALSSLPNLKLRRAP